MPPTARRNPKTIPALEELDALETKDMSPADKLKHAKQRKLLEGLAAQHDSIMKSRPSR